MTLAISTGGVSPALARKLRESLQTSDDLAWADLSGVLAVARAHLREIGLLSSIDPEAWQRCITPELLAMAQEERDAEAVELLLAGLMGDCGSSACGEPSDRDQSGCGLTPSHSSSGERP